MSVETWEPMILGLVEPYLLYDVRLSNVCSQVIKMFARQKNEYKLFEIRWVLWFRCHSNRERAKHKKSSSCKNNYDEMAFFVCFTYLIHIHGWIYRMYGRKIVVPSSNAWLMIAKWHPFSGWWDYSRNNRWNG